jgi:hypothetical protein
MRWRWMRFMRWTRKLVIETTNISSRLTRNPALRTRTRWLGETRSYWFGVLGFAGSNIFVAAFGSFGVAGFGPISGFPGVN